MYMFLIFIPKCTGGDPMVLLQRKLYFSDPEGVQHFPVGGGGGGSKYLLYKTLKPDQKQL